MEAEENKLTSDAPNANTPLLPELTGVPRMEMYNGPEIVKSAF